MSLVPSLLQAIVQLDGEALVMHAGDKPYVVSPTGQVDLATRGLTLDAVNGIVSQLLPDELQNVLEEFGAVQYDLPASGEFPDEVFTVVAARGGEDVWVEVRRRRVPDEDRVPDELFGPRDASVAAAPYPVYANAGSPELESPTLPDALELDEGLAVEEPAAPLSDEERWAPPVVADVRATEAEIQLEVERVAPPPIEDTLRGTGVDGTDFVPSTPVPVSAPAPEPPIAASVSVAPQPPAFEPPPPPDRVAEIRAAADAPAKEPVAEITHVYELADVARPVPAPTPEIPAPVALTESARPIEEDRSRERLAPPVMHEPARPIEADRSPERLAPRMTPAPEPPIAAPVSAAPQPPAFEPPPPPDRVAEIRAVADAPPKEPVAEITHVHELADVEPAPTREIPAPVAVTEPTRPIEEDRSRERVTSPVTPEPTRPIEEDRSRERIMPPVTPEPTRPIEEDRSRERIMPPVTPEPARPVEADRSRERLMPPVTPERARPIEEDRSRERVTSPATPEPPRSSSPRPVAAPEPPQPAVVLPLARNPIRGDHQPPPSSDPTMSGLDRLLRLSAARGASTLYLSSESRPSVRVDGELQLLDGEPELTPRDVESLLLTLMPERSHEALRTGAATEWICDIEDVGRVRCMSFRDHRGPGGVFRLMPTRSVSADQLGLPRTVQALAIEPEGLIIVAGPRSSGKRTLMSAFVDLINRSLRDHVITIEREVNIVHERGSSFISQREVRGNDDDMLAAARAALREDPDVLVIEDLHTAGLVNVALEAASSGHLVIGGFSAHTATAAFDRIIDLYPPEERPQVQFALADTLRGVIVQVLMRKAGGGRVAAREVLLNTPAVSSVIAEGKTSQLPMALEGGRRYGMVPLNDALVGLVQQGVVDAREAYRYATDRPGLLAALKRQGVDTSFVERLA
jgi:twitching motility protein PilT